MQRRPEGEADLADIWSFLRQILQGISTALQPADPDSQPAADAGDAGASGDDTAKTLSQLLDVLKQLQETPQDVVYPGGGAARFFELCDQLKQAAAAAPSAGLPGPIHQLLHDLREHLSGLAWGRLAKEVADEEGSAADAMPRVRADAPGALPNHPEDSLQAILRRAAVENGPAARSLNSEAIQSRASSTLGPLPEDLKSQSTAAAPAAPAGEGGRGLEAVRPEVAAADASGSVTGVYDHPDASADGGRQPADGRLMAKAFAGADAANMENTDPAEPFEMGTAEQRLLHPHPSGPEKAADAVGAGKEKESAGTGRAGIFDQIVQRALVQVKTGQSEIKIDLKPDFLGHVRMQIVSENQQVSVRILTELPAVRDMIETGLQQLRSELQNQGLHVDRLEVAVSDDPRQPPRRRARPDDLPKAGGAGTVAGTEGPDLNAQNEPIYYQRRAGRTATIDMFV